MYLDLKRVMVASLKDGLMVAKLCCACLVLSNFPPLPQTRRRLLPFPVHRNPIPPLRNDRKGSADVGPELLGRTRALIEQLCLWVDCDKPCTYLRCPPSVVAAFR